MTSANSLKGKHVNVAMMTSGGLAPCLSASVAYLIRHWMNALKAGEISGLSFRLYRGGYIGILSGNSLVLPESDWEAAATILPDLGGSPIGNSRVKLSNAKDCERRKLVEVGEPPLKVAAEQLIKDEVNVLHTIGGDDTNTQAAELSKYILDNYGGKVLVIGMPKTIDNDVIPVAQTLGANTAAQEGSRFFARVISESTASPRMLLLLENMGRDSGYLTAATAKAYRDEVWSKQELLPNLVTNKASRDIHAIWIPELELDVEAEGKRLKKIMDEVGCVNIFFAAGTGTDDIIREMEASGKPVPRDAYGHPALSKVSGGEYFANIVSKLVLADKTMVQKSGYYARSAPANDFDKDLIEKCSKAGVASAIAGVSGCMGQDEGKEGHPIRAIEFERIKGGKPFDAKQAWFQEMLKDIGQVSA
jgi:pyrophosphate--fructose-6-phosphate 1-phosphotransferase